MDDLLPKLMEFRTALTAIQLDMLELNAAMRDIQKTIDENPSASAAINLAPILENLKSISEGLPFSELDSKQK